MVQYLFQLVNPSVVDVVVVYDIIVVVVVKIKYNDEIQIKMRLHQYLPASLPSPKFHCRRDYGNWLHRGWPKQTEEEELV